MKRRITDRLIDDLHTLYRVGSSGGGIRCLMGCLVRVCDTPCLLVDVKDLLRRGSPESKDLVAERGSKCLPVVLDRWSDRSDSMTTLASSEAGYIHRVQSLCNPSAHPWS
jgi:hypothetical protein